MAIESVDSIKKLVLKDGRFTCFHRIKELTKNEYVAVGWDGNILRWAATGTSEQKWLIVPRTAEGDCTIITLQNGECMAVGDNGNIRRWAATGGAEQRFRFVNPRRSDGSFNIQERTADENVAVGSNGNVLRWRPTTGEEQRFILEPVDEVKPAKEEPQVTVGITRYAPNEVPTHPLIPSLTQSPPDQSEEYLIGVERIPSVLVDDPGRTDKLQQVREQPYYYLVQTRFWRKIFDKKLLPGVEDSIEQMARIGSSVTEVKEVEKTMGVVVSAKVAGPVKKVSAELAAQFSWQIKDVLRRESKSEQYAETKARKDVRVKGECRIVAWQVVDQFALYNYDEARVASWSAYSDRIEWDAFPKRANSS